MLTYWVYIVASKPYGTLYIGVTNDLLGRVEAHRSGTGSKFTSRYGVRLLVYFEPFAEIEEAIQREKTLTHWVRQWKINLIERENPRWDGPLSRVAGPSGKRERNAKPGNGSSRQARG